MRQLDISNCMVTPQVLPYLRRLTGLRDLRISNRVLDDVAYSCDGQTDFSDLALTQVDKVAVEHENAVQVNKTCFDLTKNCVLIQKHKQLTSTMLKRM